MKALSIHFARGLISVVSLIFHIPESWKVYQLMSRL